MSELEDHEVVKVLLTLLGSRYPEPPIPVDAVDQAVAQFRPIYDLDDQQWGLVAKIIKSKVKITMEGGASLVSSTFEDWLARRHAEVQWKRWISYKHLLAHKGFAPGVLATLDATTGDVLNCLGDPTKQGSWKRRGLVIGDVQSGKTATYLGIVNRAADAGYRLIILLAGGTEALRKQTQFRVDEGLIGRDTSRGNNLFGVSTWQETGFVGAQALTTQESDFRKTSKQAASVVVDANSPTPLVFVVKKNKTALENVRDWLKQQRIGETPLDVPMLLVDDESDYASVNTREEDSPTTINGLIRDVLTLSGRTSYLAFTATPFANVFIDHETEDEVLGDDLFPTDYIRTLDAPSNYVGSNAYFGSDDEADASRLVELTDAAEFFPHRHKSHLKVNSLPGSLRSAIRTFVVAAAIREARGDGSPRSMLVNVSRYMKVQAQVHELVQAEFEMIKAAVELHSLSIASSAGEHPELQKLRKSFDDRFGDIPESWHDVVPHLKAAVHGTAVRLINSERVKAVKDLADLETDRMIAVGGDVLSRGLTLDGLTVSYFHRQVGAADTLLQMARWFGYRPGYDDLCRVWIPGDVADQFRYVAGIIEDLRAQIRVMKKQGLTPRDFGLRVRMHPESLLITARNKMRSAEARAWTVSIAASPRVETKRVDASPLTVADNKLALSKLIESVEAIVPGTKWQDGSGSIHATRNVPKGVVADFLEQYVGFATDPLFADSALARFVRETSHPTLQAWTVGLMAGNGDPISLAAGINVSAVTRSVASSAEPVEVHGVFRNDLRVSGSSARLAGSGDVARAGQVTVGEKTEPKVYANLSAPVLLLYPIEPIPKMTKEEGTGTLIPDQKACELLTDLHDSGHTWLVGVKVGIPGEPGDRSADVKYMLNSVALEAWRGATVDDIPDDDEDVDGADDE